VRPTSDRTERQLEPQKPLPQPQCEDQRQSRLEKDKAVARVSRIIMRQQQVMQRRRSGSQPNVASELTKLLTRSTDDMNSKVQSQDSDWMAKRNILPVYVHPRSSVVQRPANVVDMESESNVPLKNILSVTMDPESTGAVSVGSDVNLFQKNHPPVAVYTESGESDRNASVTPIVSAAKGTDTAAAAAAAAAAAVAVSSVNVDLDDTKSAMSNVSVAVDTEENTRYQC